MDEELAKVRARFPPPWIVGWWRDLPEGAGRVGFEATLRLGPKRYDRLFGTGTTWMEARKDMRRPSMPSILVAW